MKIRFLIIFVGLTFYNNGMDHRRALTRKDEEQYSFEIASSFILGLKAIHESHSANSEVDSLSVLPRGKIHDRKRSYCNTMKRPINLRLERKKIWKVNCEYCPRIVYSYRERDLALGYVRHLCNKQHIKKGHDKLLGYVRANCYTKETTLLVARCPRGCKKKFRTKRTISSIEENIIRHLQVAHDKKGVCHIQWLE